MATKTKLTAENRLANELNGEVKTLSITPPKFQTVKLTIRGTAPLVINRFGAKAIEMIRSKHLAGSTARKGGKREAKDFDQLYRDAQHVSTDGWQGIHAAGFRCAMVDACKIVGFKMTLAKLGIKVEADGYDRVDGMPLVRITKGEPRPVEHITRNATGVVDLRCRPMWDPGWEAIITISYDADMFTTADVVNLLARVGVQCGIGEGRPNSKASCGQGWGLFEIVNN